MSTATSAVAVERLLEPLGSCLTPESARRLLELKADRTLDARVQDLAARHARGQLSEAETAEYGNYVAYSTFIAVLKSRARRILAENDDRQ